MKRILSLSLVLGVILCLAAAGGAEAQASMGAIVGQKAPKFANLRLMDSSYMYGSDYLGKGWLLLSFFGTDCAPCVRELPVLERLLADHAAGGAAITGFLFVQDAERAAASAYFAGRQTPFIVLYDGYNTTYRKYKGPGDTVDLPLTVVVAPDGTVAFMAHSGSEEDLAALLAFVATHIK